MTNSDYLHRPRYYSGAAMPYDFDTLSSGIGTVPNGGDITLSDYNAGSIILAEPATHPLFHRAFDTYDDLSKAWIKVMISADLTDSQKDDWIVNTYLPAEERLRKLDRDTARAKRFMITGALLLFLILAVILLVSFQ